MSILLLSWCSSLESNPSVYSSNSVDLMKYKAFINANSRSKTALQKFNVNEKFAIYLKVREIAKNLEINPDWLIKAIYYESGWSATIVNNIGATGLIQFTKTTARYLGTTTKQIAKMPILEQLDLTEKYLSHYKKHLTSYFNVRLALFYPDALGKSCYIIGMYPSKTYTENASIDVNKDKILTVYDYRRYVHNQM